MSFSLSICSISFIIFLLAPSSASPEDPQKTLSEIQEKLKSTIEKVKESKEKEKSVLQSIEDIEKSIKDKERELKGYDNRISQNQSQIQTLSEEINVLSGKLESTKGHLKERLRALYKQQYGGHALILISATDYQDLIKKSKYISLVAHYDNKVINKYSTDLREINTKKKELETLHESLRANKSLAQRTRRALQNDRKNKDKLLASIRSKRMSYEKTVLELEESSKKLLEMMKKMEQKQLPASIAGKGFRTLKGRLDWPVEGTIVIPYGKYKDPVFNITVFKNGIELKPKGNEKPKAIAGGRVVYADWFKGYGLLLIIDHGSGYHSLYGNLSEIFLKPGDILIEGSSVGKIGNSNLLGYPTLYFEIRYKGQPVDPLGWLRKAGPVGKRIK